MCGLPRREMAASTSKTDKGRKAGWREVDRIRDGLSRG
jgi:hypothetical protein